MEIGIDSFVATTADPVTGAKIDPAVLAGPVAGVVLDRMDRRKVMLLSDTIRAVVALAHVLLLTWRLPWLLYLLSGLLTFGWSDAT